MKYLVAFLAHSKVLLAYVGTFLNYLKSLFTEEWVAKASVYEKIFLMVVVGFIVCCAIAIVIAFWKFLFYSVLLFLIGSFVYSQIKQ